MTHQPEPEVVPFSESFIGKLSEFERHAILKMRDEGKTYLDIACEFGISDSTVRDVVKRRWRRSRRNLMAAYNKQAQESSNAV
jgi:DNA-directed RNA polymerase specialized sigma24 family protein